MLQVFNASGKALRDRINSVKNTQKITDAMKLVAAAKVRRAQDAVVNGRPFSENLVKVHTARCTKRRCSLGIRTQPANNDLAVGAIWCQPEVEGRGRGLSSGTDPTS